MVDEHELEEEKTVKSDIKESQFGNPQYKLIYGVSPGFAAIIPEGHIVRTGPVSPPDQDPRGGDRYWYQWCTRKIPHGEKWREDHRASRRHCAWLKFGHREYRTKGAAPVITLSNVVISAEAFFYKKINASGKDPCLAQRKVPTLWARIPPIGE